MIYVSIGNSDNKLTQQEWANFWHDVNATVRVYCEEMHGVWHSEPVSPYQNACWGFEAKEVEKLKKRLGILAYRYRQSSIAWCEGDAKFIQPVEVAR